MITEHAKKSTLSIPTLSRGATALMLVADGSEPCHPAQVHAFLAIERRAGSTKLVEAQDFDGNNVLHYTLKGIASASRDVAERKAAIARELIEAGADLFQENHPQIRPVDFLSPEIAQKFDLPYPTATPVRGLGDAYMPR